MQDKRAVPLEQVLNDVSAQLEALCKQAAKLEQTVGRVVEYNSEIPRALIHEMQSLDRVNQGLQDMAVLTALLAKSTGSETVSADEAVVICNAVKLSATKALFCAQAKVHSGAQANTASSGVHLF